MAHNNPPFQLAPYITIGLFAGLRASELAALDWREINPRIEDSGQRPEEIVNRLFPGHPLLCRGKSNADFDTKPREAWRGELSALQLIVPSPMSDIEGATNEGKPSCHTQNDTGPRREYV